jgi:predicted exporter
VHQLAPPGSVQTHVPRIVRVTVWLALVIACIWIVARAEYRADISAFLPKSPTPNQQLLVDQLKDGAVSRLMLIGIEGADAKTLAAISKGVAKSLRADPQWAVIGNGEAIGIEADGKFLLENRYLLSMRNDAAMWQTENLRNALAESRQLLAQSAGMFVKDLIPRDPTGEVMRMLDELQTRSAADTKHGVWMGKTSSGGPRAVLLAQTRAAGVDLDGQQRAVDAAKRAFETAKAATPDATKATLLLSGTGVFSAASRERIKDDATRFSVIATALVVMLIWWVYRSPRVMGLGLLPVATGVLAGIAAVALVFGSVHGITLGFGATLIGEAVDYAIYLFTLIRRRSDFAAQDATPNAVLTMNTIWPTLRLGVWTSICGFSAMVLSDFPGLQQLGMFSVAGLIAAVLVTRWLLPYLLPNDFQIRPTRLGEKLLVVARQAPRLRIPVALVVVALAAFAVLSKQELWNDDLSNLSPISLAEQKLDEEMRNALGAPDVRYIVVADDATLEPALVKAERASAALEKLRETNVIKSFDSPTAYLPSLAAQRARRDAIPAASELNARFEEVVKASGFAANAFAPFLADATAAKTRPPVTRATLEGTQLAHKVDALIIAKPGRVTAMLPLQGVANEAALRAAIAPLTDANIRLIDMKVESNELYQKYRHQALTYALSGVAAIALLLMITLRSPLRALRVLLPLGFAVVVTAAILLALGVSLSIFHLVAFLLVIGVGSNYALFFDQQAGLGQAQEQEQDQPAAPVMLALVVCNLSTVFGFGALAFSSMPVLKAIGGTVGIGAVLCLIFSAAFIQPAPIEKRDEKRQEKHKERHDA